MRLEDCSLQAVVAKSLDKRRIIRRRINADRWLIHDPDQNIMAVFQYAKLLKVLKLLQRGARQFGELQQEVAPIGVQPQMLKEMRRFGHQ